jgi:nicotinate-nucleotide adenylyltransferase
LMRVGLFGGTFDPVHNGHLRVAEEVREHFGLEKVYFIPAFIQPLKRRIKVTAAADRLKMVEMATRSNTSFHASQIEMRRGGVSYSIDTIRAFAARYGEVHFLVGLDAFSEIHLWKDYREIFEQADLIILVRPTHKKVNPGDVFPATLRPHVKAVDENTYEHSSGKRIYFLRVTQLDISSTMIRELARNGSSIKYLVSYGVERFIKKRGLYRT